MLLILPRSVTRPFLFWNLLQLSNYFFTASLFLITQTNWWLNGSKLYVLPIRWEVIVICRYYRIIWSKIVIQISMYLLSAPSIQQYYAIIYFSSIHFIHWMIKTKKVNQKYFLYYTLHEKHIYEPKIKNK